MSTETGVIGGLGEAARQSLQQQGQEGGEKSFLDSTLKLSMMLQSMGAFCETLEKFCQANELGNPDKWSELLNSTNKSFKMLSSILESDPVGVGATLKDLPTLGAEGEMGNVADEAMQMADEHPDAMQGLEGQALQESYENFQNHQNSFSESLSEHALGDQKHFPNVTEAAQHTNEFSNHIADSGHQIAPPAANNHVSRAAQQGR